ncbi:hypothetical protein D3C86_1825670 [compost metagenome]
MARQFAPVDMPGPGQRMHGTAHRDHLDGTQTLTLEGFGHLLMVEQQAEVGAALQQLARNLALGAAGQLHLQQRESLGQGLEAVEHRLVGHGLVLGQAQAHFLTAHQSQRPSLQALALAQHLARLFQ